MGTQELSVPFCNSDNFLKNISRLKKKVKVNRPAGTQTISYRFLSVSHTYPTKHQGP